MDCDHSTVCHGIQRIKALRESDPDVDVLLSQLKRQLVGDHNELSDTEDENENLNAIRASKLTVDELAELVAERVCAYLEKQLQHLS